jgi:sugar (pentulose or hexulose) kinase
MFRTSVHGGLDKVLGVSGADAVLMHMKMTNNLPNPAEFHRKLLALFGAQGTLSLERAIVKDLAIRLRWSMAVMKKEDGFDFSATMRAIEQGVKA